MATRYSSRTGLPLTYQAGPYSVAAWKLQWGGKLPGGESWSCGLRMIPTSGSPPTVIQSMCDAAGAAVLALHQNVGLSLSVAALLSYVKLNNVDIMGKQGLGTTISKTYPDSPGASAAYPANQICLAVSLTTGLSRGPAHRGRFFLPMPCASIVTDGRISAAAAQNASGAVDTFVATLNSISAVMQVGIMSRKLNAPAHRPVTGNLIGRVLDTQRRRRRKLVEDWQ